MTQRYNNVMDSIMSSGKSKMVFSKGLDGAYGPGMDAAGAGTGLAFLVGELEKQDPRLLEPMTALYAPRDIDMKPGGGWVTLTSNVYVDYATTGNDEDSIIGSETTNIPVSQANITKDVFKVHTFSEILRAPLFDDLKLQQIGRSLTQILDDGLRLNHSKMIDLNVYRGISKTGTYGIVNNPLIATSLAALNASNTSRLWVNKTPVEIMADVNGAIELAWADAQYDLSGMPNHILIDPANYAYIVNTPVTAAGTQSILNYLLTNNIAVNQGREVNIYPNRFCIGAGTAGTQRMVVYVKAENRLNCDLSVPLSRVMTAPSVQSASFETLYAAQFSQVKFLFTQCVQYIDGL
jgi:hypothetical protein